MCNPAFWIGVHHSPSSMESRLHPSELMRMDSLTHIYLLKSSLPPPRFHLLFCSSFSLRILEYHISFIFIDALHQNFRDILCCYHTKTHWYVTWLLLCELTMLLINVNKWIGHSVKDYKLKGYKAPQQVKFVQMDTNFSMSSKGNTFQIWWLKVM